MDASGGSGIHSAYLLPLYESPLARLRSLTLATAVSAMASHVEAGGRERGREGGREGGSVAEPPTPSPVCPQRRSGSDEGCRG